ncbi:sulfatase-like hydrolase/transferase [Salipiger thiooxidans]|nr:sulfatase-like hydrolase/transferase [Salipiger thiooxidans]
MHSDSFIGGFTGWWLDNKPREKPLFLSIGFPGPHPPYDPTPEYAAKYMAQDVPMPHITQDEIDRLPPPWKEKRRHDSEFDHDAVHWNLEPSEADLHKMRAYYYANVEMIDREVGRILDALERRGRLDNSVVIFTSDHGDNLGDHGLSQKWAPYEQVTRVPMVISQPGRFPARRFDGLVQLFDLGPTILQLAGITPDAGFEARSLVDILEGTSDAGREHVYCEQCGDPSMTGADMLTMIRSRTHKLVSFLGQDYGQLFDLEADPGETDDLWDAPEAAPVKAALLAELGRWHHESTYRTRHVRARMMEA